MYAGIESILNDESGRELVLRMSRRVITWDEMVESPLPRGMGARQTWHSLRSLRAASGIGTPFTEPGVSRSWYSMTLELSEMVSRIQHECHEDSRLWQMFKHSSDQHFVTGMRVSDALASTELDGLALSAEEVSSLLRYDQAPRTDAERLVKNSYTAVDKIPSLVEEPFSVELLRELEEMVTAGVDLDHLVERPRKPGLMPFDMGNQNEHDAENFLDTVARYANDELGDPHDPPVMRCLFLMDMMYGRHPMGKVSGQVGRLASHLYATKHQLPLLSVLPHLKARVDWGMGLIKPPTVTCDRSSLVRTGVHAYADGTADSTLHQTIMAQLTCHLINELRIKVATWNERDESMRLSLQHDAEFNQRQRSILSRAVRRPEAVFSIKYHQTNHAISYATARRDLVELEQKGYLVMTLSGHTMLFHPSDGLAEKLGLPATLYGVELSA